MSSFKRYLAEEIACDHADGVFGRREALRRLGMLGMGVAAGANLLAACGGDADEGSGAAAPSGSASSSASGPASGSTPPGVASALPAETVTFRGPGGRTLRGAWAAAPRPRAGVLVIHENKGLTTHIRSVAGRLAGAGYGALAVDLLSEEGGTGAVGDEAAATAELAKVSDDRFVADLRAGVDELTRRVPGRKLGVVGFCFGGGLTWLLLASGEARLAAAAPFYGPLPDGADFSRATAAVMGVYGELDTRVTPSRDDADAALRRAGLEHELVTYPGAGHAFFNDTGARYDPTAATAVWTKLQDWFAQHLH